MSCFSSQTHFWIYTVAAPKVYHGQCLALNQTSQNSPRAKWSLNLYTSATVGIKCIRGGKKLLLPNLAGLKVFLHKVVCDLKSCFFRTSSYFFILVPCFILLDTLQGWKRCRLTAPSESSQLVKFYFLLVFTPSILCSIVSSRCSSLSWNLKVVDTRWAQIGDLEMQAWERGVPKKSVRAIDKRLNQHDLAWGGPTHQDL